MTLHDVALSDRYDLSKRLVLLSGGQALVRATLMQKVRDAAAGLNTAGYVTGYRGSPLGGLDMQMSLAAGPREAHDVRFEPGLNEELAATAIWGAQQAELHGEGRFDGVFGLWYGKGPGVDRCGDVFRHANMAGVSAHGGVVVCMGDDHTGESSTTLHHSEFALVDAMMPILSPAGVQEVLDYALMGWAMSRYAGVWTGLKCVKDTIEVTQVVDGDPHRLAIAAPRDFLLPPDGLNIRLGDTPVAQEARLHDYKRYAAEAFARANRLDRRVHGRAGARIGIVSSGKSWLDTSHALQLLGIDDAVARDLGVTTYKVAVVWPLDSRSFREWAEGLDLIVVVEEKRKLIEVQIKEAIFNDRRGRRVFGWKNDRGDLLFSVKEALDPVRVAVTLGRILEDEGVVSEALRRRRAALEQAAGAEGNASPVARRPWFCAGCPHNTSTRIPHGARAYAGIGCHYMVQWMDRDTQGFTHMGGEGANWIGEAPFSTRAHVFQNLGDGTYNHSGVQAIRAALAARVNITFKILFNDAVAMTGGQKNEGDLTAARIARELVALGVERVVAVYDPKEEPERSAFPPTVPLRPRDELDEVQRELQDVAGVTAIIYMQTCASEKRRRRKRGAFPDPDRRVFINPHVCEGCGDCGVKSNCVAIAPLETEFGRKRAIDQSSCNKDFSCLDGFCPSFVTLEGAQPRREPRAPFVAAEPPEPDLPGLDDVYSLVVTGIGGTGVVTVGALIAMAARIEGKGVAVMEMAGLAQKGGAVQIHCRIADRPERITAVRVAAGEADALIGGDLVVSAADRTLALLRPGRTRAVLNAHRTITADFTRDRDLAVPFDALVRSVADRIGADDLVVADATRLAEARLGDAIYANLVLLGMAWQSGLVPLSAEAILRAIEINGASIDGNRQAFLIGRQAVARPADDAGAIEAAEPAPAVGLDRIVEVRARHAQAYQGAALAERYRQLVDLARGRDADFAVAVAKGYHKLLTYKDEYEVARLHHETLREAVDRQFQDVRSLRIHLAPPLLARKGPDGVPRKRAFGPWILPVFGALKRLRRLRGTPFDPFGWTAERRMERALISQYEADMRRIITAWTPDARPVAVKLALLPLEIRGFGHVKRAAALAVAQRRAALLAEYDAGDRPPRLQAAE